MIHIKINFKIPIFLLVFYIIFNSFSLISCSNKKGTEDTDENISNSEDSHQSMQNIEQLKDDLPDGLDFGEIEIKIQVRDEDFSKLEMYAESETGDIINDAIYNRNRQVEDRLNVRINIVPGDGWSTYENTIAKIRASIIAGDKSYDLIAGWSARIPALSLEGLFMNLKGMQYIDLEKPWWSQTLAKELTINNKLFLCSGDITLTQIASSSVIYINKELAQKFEIGDIYKIVLDGKWTLDKFYEMTKSVSEDVNGDGAMDDQDIYGAAFTTYNIVDGFMQSSQIKLTGWDSAGYPVWQPEKEKLATLVEKVYDLLFSNPGAITYKGEGEFAQNLTRMFKNNQLLFYPSILLQSIEELRDMETDYGIIPYPKYDETQDIYTTRIWDNLNMMSIPISCDKTEAVCALLEAMAHESYTKVTPVYFDTAMKIKFSRENSEISSQMLDLIRDGAYLNFASIYNDSISFPWYIMRNLMTAGSNNFASWFDKNSELIEKSIEDLIQKFQ